MAVWEGKPLLGPLAKCVKAANASRTWEVSVGSKFMHLNHSFLQHVLQYQKHILSSLHLLTTPVITKRKGAGTPQLSAGKGSETNRTQEKISIRWAGRGQQVVACQSCWQQLYLQLGGLSRQHHFSVELKSQHAWVLFAAQVRWWAHPESDHRLAVARGHEVGRECLSSMEGQILLSPHQSESLFFKAQLKSHSSERPQLLPYILHPFTCVYIVP